MSIVNYCYRLGEICRNPDHIAGYGALIEVEIHVSSLLAEHHRKRSETVPPPVTGLALLDTGSECSGVARSVLESLGMKPISKVLGITASGPTTFFLYFAKFRFPGANGFCTEDIKVVAVDFTRLPTPDPEQQVIATVGRDILSNAILIYNGVNSTYSFAI